MPEPAAPRPAVFLDRDGTISEEVGYLNHVSRFRMFPFAAPAIRRLNEAGYPVVVVSNQSGVSRGYFPESFLQTITELMTAQLAAAGARVDAVYYCPHTAAEGCECRKPKTGMLDRAAREHALDLGRSYVVGDKYVDIDLAHNVRAQGILVRTGYGEGELQWNSAEWPAPPDFIAEDLSQAADWILRQPQ